MKIRKLGDKKWKVVLFQGSPRDPDTCPNMESKTHKVIDYVIEKWSPFIDFKVIDLSINNSKKPSIQSCKGCISTAGGYHCIAEGERVETKYGYKKIEDIVIGDELSTGVVYNSMKTGDNSIIYEVTTSDGRKIKLTDNHPIKVINPIYKNNNKKKLKGYIEEWIDVKNLKIGYRIPFKFTGEFEEDESNLEKYLLCGLLWGDGAVHHKRLKLCYDIRDEILIKKISKNFNISISEKGFISKNTEVKWIKFNDDDTNLFINNLIFEEKSKNIYDRRIPESIMNSSKSQVSNFLNGWFASDGSIIKRNIRGNDYYEINLTSVSKDSLRDCQLLLSKFGIKSSITYLDHIESFRFNKFIKRASMLVISGLNANIFMEKIGIFNKDYKFKKISYRKSKNYDYYGKIEKIEEIGRSNVYDISVSKSHKFICEGIEVHNCHFPCSCYFKGGKTTDLLSELNVYELLQDCDAFLIFSPIHWHSLSSQIKTLFDRLVCVNQTLTIDDAKKIMGDNIKNSKVTGSLSKSGKYDNMLRNHLEGKVAGFWVQGDDGADDYEGKELPESYSDVLDDGFSNNPKSVVMPFVMQLKYSGVFVPDQLIEAFYTNKNMNYYLANQTINKNKEFFDRADNLLENLLNYLDETKKD
jgi:intein/homing endonuclease